MYGARRGAGFTLLEMLVTIGIIALIATMTLPLVELDAKLAKEQALRIALRDIRDALDAYRRAADDGRIERQPGDSGYPPSLLALVQGVPDLTGAPGKRLYFLTAIPRDPFNTDAAVPPERTWGLRSYESPPEAPRPGLDVFDVYSQSRDKAFDGTPYADW